MMLEGRCACRRAAATLDAAAEIADAIEQRHAELFQPLRQNTYSTRFAIR